MAELRDSLQALQGTGGVDMSYTNLCDRLRQQAWYQTTGQLELLVINKIEVQFWAPSVYRVTGQLLMTLEVLT